MNKNVQAIVLAGGKGTRLAPLTENTPKPMLKFLGKTVIERTFDKLKQADIKNVSVTTMHLAWQIEALGEIEGIGKINYIREKEALGTAGAVKNAYDGKSENVVVLSGDGIFDFDLNKILEFHTEKCNDVTIVTIQSENPTEYGVVMCDENGKVEKFTEKPSWAFVTSGNVNTGIYVLNKKVLEKIPENTVYDFSKQLFPLLLAGNYQMYSFPAKGVWYDIGNIDSYFSAIKSALSGKISGIENNGLTEEELKEKNVDFESPVYVSRKAILGQNIKLGAFSVIEEAVVLGDGADISMSVILDGVSVGMGCGISGSVVGKNSSLGENCIIPDGSAIGANCKIDDSVILPKYAFVHSASHITDIKRFKFSGMQKIPALFLEEGIEIEKDKLNAEFLLGISHSLADAFGKRKEKNLVKIAIMSSEDEFAEHAKNMVLQGLLWSGIRSIDCEKGTESIARFISVELETDLTVYITESEQNKLVIKFFDDYGLYICNDTEKEISNCFTHPSGSNIPNTLYSPEILENTKFIYYNDLIKECKTILGGNTLKGIKCNFSVKDVKTGNESGILLDFAKKAVFELGATVVESEEKPDFSFVLGKEGESVECECMQEHLDSSHIDAVIIESGILCESLKEKTIFLESNMPETIKKSFKGAGYTVFEYAKSEIKDPLCFSKEQMRAQRMFSDALFKALVFVICAAKSNNFKDILEKIPSFNVVNKDFVTPVSRTQVMQKLYELASKGERLTNEKIKREGIHLVMSNGEVTVIPRKTSGFKIISEAASFEAANELCENTIKMFDKNL